METIVIPNTSFKVRIIDLDYVLLFKTNDLAYDMRYKLAVIEAEMGELVEDMDSGEYGGVVYTGYSAQFKDLIDPFVKAVQSNVTDFAKAINSFREEIWARNEKIQRQIKLQALLS